MIAQYSFRKQGPGQPYTFTSRGPAPDGSMCVHVCAPGGAVASLPNYTCQGVEQFNGTSMASPHCAGCICKLYFRKMRILRLTTAFSYIGKCKMRIFAGLLLSLARQRGITWTPYSVKASLVNTALDFDFPDPFAKGYGLVQVRMRLGGNGNGGIYRKSVPVLD